MAKYYSKIYKVDKTTTNNVARYLDSLGTVNTDYIDSEVVLSRINHGLDGRVFILKPSKKHIIITSSVSEKIHNNIERIVEEKAVTELKHALESK